MDYSFLDELQPQKETGVDYDEIINKSVKKEKQPRSVNPNLQPSDEWLKPTALEKLAQSAPIKFLGDLGAGTMGALAGAVRGADWLGKTVAMQPQMPPEIEKKRTNITDILASKLSEQGEKSSEMGFESGSIPKYVSQGIGGAAVSVPLMAAGGIVPYSLATAGGQAKSEDKSQPEQLKESLIGGATGLVIDKILHGIGKKELSMIPRQLLGASTMAGVPLVEETTRKIVEGKDPKDIDWKKVTADFIQGALFPIGGKKKNDPKLATQAPTIEPKVPLTKDTQAGKIVEPGATSRGIGGKDASWSGVVYRGRGSSPSDSGDLGIGEYHTTDISSAKAYGPTTKSDITLKNPLKLSSEDAAKLVDKYGTLRGTPEERLAASTKLTNDMEAAGHDGIVVDNYDTNGTTVIKFPNQKTIGQEIGASKMSANEYIAVGDKKQHKVKVVDERPQVNAGDPLLGDGLVTEQRKINDIHARELTGNNRTVIKSISNTSKEKGAGTDFMIGEIRSEHTKGNTVVSDSLATSKQAYDMYRKIDEAHGANSPAPEFDLRIVGKNESGGDRIEIFKLGDKNAENFPAFKQDAAKPTEITKPTPPTMNKLPMPEAPKPQEPAIRQTVTNSINKVLAEKTDQSVGEMKFYKPDTNERQINDARDRIKIQGVDARKKDLINKDRFTEDDVVEGGILLSELRDSGDYVGVAELARRIAPAGTEIARGLQAFNTYDILKTPEVIAERIFREAQKELGDKTPKLTPELIKELHVKVKRAEQMPTDELRERAVAEIFRDIRGKLPVSVWKKVSTIQAINQLLNAKTITRNILGNVGLNVMEIAAHHIGIPIDKMLSRYTQKRSVVAPNFNKYMNELRSGFRKSVDDIRAGINTSKIDIEHRTGMKIPGELDNMFSFSSGETFKKNTFWGKLERMVGYTMQAPDRAFFEARFWDSADNMLRAQKITKLTPEIVEQALFEASKVTFRDMNHISEALIGIKKALNKAIGFGKKKEFGLGDLALKYPKVPGAIIKRGIEYSPFGFLESAIKTKRLIKNGAGANVAEQREAALSSARAIIGTTIAMTGYALAKAGLVTGQKDDNIKVSKFEEAIGKRPYSIKALNGFLSYDWFQPASMPFTMGVDIATKKELEKRGSGAAQQLSNYIMGTMGAAGSTIADQPVMTGVSRLFGGEKYGGNMVEGLAGGLMSSVAAAPSTFVPTLFGQIAATIDPNKREIPKDFSGRMLGLIANRTPGLSILLNKRISVLGEDLKRGTGNVLVDAIINIASPAIYSKLKEDKNVQLISNLYAETKDREVLPRRADTDIIKDGNKIYELTAAQKNRLQELTAKEAIGKIEKYSRGMNFDKMSEESKIRTIKRIYDIAGETARLIMKRELRNK